MAYVEGRRDGNNALVLTDDELRMIFNALDDMTDYPEERESDQDCATHILNVIQQSGRV